MTSLAQPAVAEASTDAEQADAPGRAPPEPDVETGLDEEFLAPPSAVPLDAAGLIRLIAPMLGLDPARIAVTPGPPAARPGAISLGADLERGVVAHELAH
ncbi:MAG TPA: hypothetical protein VGP56_00190, partial [Gaiellaceae bacterium]|nr:hypothetical protein [Gaiellaceae bacterium]